jgi:hypothetical protein
MIQSALIQQNEMVLDILRGSLRTNQQTDQINLWVASVTKLLDLYRPGVNNATPEDGPECCWKWRWS